MRHEKLIDLTDIDALLQDFLVQMCLLAPVGKGYHVEVAVGRSQTAYEYVRG